MTLKSLLESVVFSIVDNAAHVKIEQTDEKENVSFKVAVAKEDVGKLIGTQGRIASAIRTVMKAAGAKQGVRVLINVDKTPLE